MGRRYRIMPLTKAIAAKYKHMASLTTALAAMPTPRSFQQYQVNRDMLLAMPDKYHDLWYFRSFFESERMCALGTCDIMPLGKDVTVKAFTTVFPDSVGHLMALAKYYDIDSVVTVLRKLGYLRRGLPASHATMHLCFLGQLHALEIGSKISAVVTALAQCTRQHMNGKYCGHPHRVFSDACKRAVGE